MPRKRFGQNFLHDPGIIRRIVAAVDPKPDEHCVEIGPGQGAITRELVRRAGQLDVIEIDRDLAATLAEQDWLGETQIHVGDALAFDFGTIVTPTKRLRLIGNLPYNISTPLLFHVLEQLELFADIHVMLQKEVVQRMAAPANSSHYGRLSVALAAHCRVESLFRIGPGAFRPAPKVESAFARLVPLDRSLISKTEQQPFDTIVRTAFGQRRKQLSNALSTVVPIATIRAAGIDPAARAENLSVEQFAALTRQHLEDSSAINS